MSDTTPAMSHHDLVTRIAARAFDPRIFTVYTNTQRALQRPVKGQYPHLVAVGNVDQRVEIVGMVETVESLYDFNAAAWRWRPLEHLQAAMYLYVPRADRKCKRPDTVGELPGGYAALGCKAAQREVRVLA